MDKNFKIPVSWSFKSFTKGFKRKSDLLGKKLRLMRGQCWDCRGAWCCHCPEGQQRSAGGSSREDGRWPCAQAGLQEGSVEWGTPFLGSILVATALRCPGGEWGVQAVVSQAPLGRWWAESRVRPGCSLFCLKNTSTQPL